MIYLIGFQLQQIYKWLTVPIGLNYASGEEQKAKLTSLSLLLLTLVLLWEAITFGNTPLLLVFILTGAYVLSRLKHYKYAAVMMIVVLSIPSFLVLFETNQTQENVSLIQWLLLPIILASFLLTLSGLMWTILLIMLTLLTGIMLNPAASLALAESTLFLFLVSALIVFVAYQRNVVEVARATELKQSVTSAQHEIQERQQIEAVLHKKMEQLEELRRLTLQMTAELDVDTLLNMIVTNGLTLLGGDQSGLFLYDAEEAIFVLAASSEKDETKIVHRVIPRGHGMIGYVWEAGEPLVVGDYQTWNGRIPEVAATINQKSFIAVPLQWQEEIPGVLILSSETENCFADEDLRIINFLATQATIALQNAQVNAQILENTRHLQTEIQERELAEIALRDSRKMLQTILDSISIRVFWKDLDLNYIGCNQPFAQDVGLINVENVAGKSAYELAQEPEDARIYQEQDRQIIQTNEPQLNIIQSQTTASGDYIWQRVNKMPLLNHNSELIGLIGTYEDITEQVRAQEQLQEYNKELEFTNRELQKFAYVASHDLQEPLRKIQTFGDRLVVKYGHVLDQKGLDYLDRMQNSAQRMQTLIQDLLAYSRVTMGSLETEPVNLTEIVNGVLDDLETLIEEKEAKIMVGHLPTIEADSVQMRQLFTNLLSNALKFSKDDTIAQIEISANEVKRGFWQLCVQDNGIGFDEKYEERIFGVFQRLHTKQDYKGTGVGLALCKQVVEQHGGEITAKSQLGNGATFLITLPATHL